MSMSIDDAVQILERIKKLRKGYKLELVVALDGAGAAGGTPCVPVERIYEGLDFDKGRLLIKPAEPVVSLSQIAAVKKRTEVVIRVEGPDDDDNLRCTVNGQEIARGIEALDIGKKLGHVLKVPVIREKRTGHLPRVYVQANKVTPVIRKDYRCKNCGQTWTTAEEEFENDECPECATIETPYFRKQVGILVEKAELGKTPDIWSVYVRGKDGLSEWKEDFDSRGKASEYADRLAKEV
ncbi:hypothetical protein [Acidihalobacter ferrooxydans]|uniref:Uncharacterized protein n=1 Tax=Acidihalobacter ferrooxydans TaxID=1765967 RepID=A0A1P8UFS5_9GAMM|nr:hypothetical protein [Acidihalobacter ferrooxydans]APZ42604.1 hypothetical protein BW247_05410 [Acidihalobacter ferrooxydans]